MNGHQPRTFARRHRQRRWLALATLAATGITAPACTFPEVTFGSPTPDAGDVVIPVLDVAARQDASDDGGDAQPLADAGAAEASMPLDAGDGAIPVGDAGCDFNGTWATLISIDVTWQPQGLMSVILQSGSGAITQWVKGVRVQSPAAPRSLIDTSVVCGITLPDFQATALGLNEVYGIRFPDSLFDDQYIPSFQVSGALDETMTMYSTTSTAVLLGLTMDSPTTDPWPSVVTTEVDQDNDGNPGVTVDVAQGPVPGAPTPTSYSYIPTTIPTLLLPPPSASSLYVAIRQVTVTTGTVVDCNTIEGTVSIPVIASKPAIDSHILGCALVDGGQCTTGSSSQASFVDNSQPIFTPTGTTTFRSIRVPDGATCADVRTTLTPP
jgi:hypothetical protein